MVRDELLVADDHPLWRLGLLHLLAQWFPQAGMTSCDTAVEALHLCSTCDYACVLCGWRLRDSPALALAERLQQLGKPPLLLFIEEPSPIQILQARELGIADILSTRCSEADLRHSLHHILQHKSIIPGRPSISLTPREQAVLRELARGLPNKLITRALGIAEPTLKMYLATLYRKLGVNSRTACLVAARQNHFL